MNVVGVSQKRQDSPRKLTGIEKFAGDLRFPGMLFARPVGSPSSHAQIDSIDASAALEIPGVVAVLTADDLPIARDANGNPYKTPIAQGEALWAGQIVALVLAETEAAAEDGALAVVVNDSPLPVVTSLSQAMDFSAPPVRAHGTAGGDDEASMHNADAAAKDESEKETLPPNATGSTHFKRGDVAAGFAEADEIVELAIYSDTVHQGYLEPQACVVNIGPLGDLEVYTSTQASFYCRTRVAETVGYPVHKVKVTPMPVGGGFGGKFVLIEPMVAAAAVAVNRPVHLVYTRMEDFVAGNPAPECEISIKLGGKKDGTITALEVRSVFDSGAIGSAPMEIGMILLGGYYRTDNLDIRGYAVNTHKAGGGAYRAPGAQQGSFAIESAVDELCARLGLDPVDFRIKNCVVEGDMRPNGRPWPEIGLKQALEALREHPAWANRAESRKAGRGVGVAIGGWPGGVEPATAVCRLDADGTFTIVLGSSDLTGGNTAFAQIAAEALDIPLNKVAVTTGDTSAAPFAGGTGGSKITYTVGPAVLKAAEEARQQVLSIASDHLEAAVEDLEIANGVVRVKGVPDASISLKQLASMSMQVAGKYEPVYGKGSTAITDTAPGFAVHLVEAQVDGDTGAVELTRYVAVQDVGFAINPALVDGQIRGAVAQGIGWALYEGLVFDADGQPLNPTFMDYALPKAEYVPNIETVFVEVPSVHGAHGSKGVGEPPAIPGPAAVANAIRSATGARITKLPMTASVVLDALGGPIATAAD
ncbi:MAG: xanthine dehydrogenase family protein molybdopterin-binding subunit [Thermomicrobiales bacterium]|jgi:CO/xanthine dehydrogenase Mo-binding subunit|nr:xanthine dehydrogenase family protein molybdopterin-binding subunit [Thermomicrobiales bacterium]